MARREGPSGKPTYLHKDHLGNVTAVTDDNGNTLGEYEYYPFGELKSSATSLGAWRFTSQEWDNDITSYHFPARYYDPTWCRFVTRDPIGDYWINDVNRTRWRNLESLSINSCECNSTIACDDYHQPQTWNKYYYAKDNPVNYIDPVGLRYCLITVKSGTVGWSPIIKVPNFGISVEGGEIIMTDPQTRKSYRYVYLCAGPGAQVATPGLRLTGGITGEVGVIECPEKPKDLAGLDYQVSGLAALYRGGAFSVFPSHDGGAFGGIFGIGVGISIQGCYI